MDKLNRLKTYAEIISENAQAEIRLSIALGRLSVVTGKSESDLRDEFVTGWMKSPFSFDEYLTLFGERYTPHTREISARESLEISKSLQLSLWQRFRAWLQWFADRVMP